MCLKWRYIHNFTFLTVEKQMFSGIVKYEGDIVIHFANFIKVFRNEILQKVSNMCEL
jgi:hypothetical protein